MILWRNVWLDIGYMFCISFWLPGSHVFGVFTQNGEVCSVDASVFSPARDARTWKPGNFSSNFTWLVAVMRVRIFFLGTCVRHRYRVVPSPWESDFRVVRHTMHN